MGPPRPLLFGIALGAAIALIVATAIYQQNLQKQQETHAQAYGEMIAVMLAEQAVEPMFNRDLVSLQVIVSHSNEDDHIKTITIHDVENRLLVQSGKGPTAAQIPKVQKHNYSEPITVQDNIAGHITVTIDPQSFHPRGDYRWLIGGLLGLIILGIYAWQKPDKTTAYSTPVSGGGSEHSQESPTPDDGMATEPFRAWVTLSCNNLRRLHQQLNAEAMSQVVSHLEGQIKQVSALYSGFFHRTEGQCFILEFNSNESMDQAIQQAICAADLLLSLGRSNKHPVALHYGTLVSLPPEASNLQQHLRDQEERQVLLQAAQDIPWKMILAPQITERNNLKSWLTIDVKENDQFATVSQFATPYRALLDKQLSQLRSITG